MSDAETPNLLPILDHLDGWYTNHHQELTAAGILATIEHSPPGHDKASIALAFDSEPRLAQMIIWDTGEAELDLVDLQTGTHKPQHHDITLPAQVDDLLAQVHTWVRIRQP